MKLHLEQISCGEEELIIKYREMTPKIEEIVEFIHKASGVILGKKGDRQYKIEPRNIYYFECVEEKLFACTKEAVYQVAMTLTESEQRLLEEGFFRCSKSFVVNMNKISSVKREMGNRIDAALENGEHIIISRRYVREFQEKLKGGEAIEKI